jgi:hypothetical protein
MNDLLVPLKDLRAVIKNIHVLVGMMTHGKYTPKHLQDAGVSTRGGGGTTIVGSTRRGCIRRWRGAAADGNLVKRGMERLMSNILDKPLMSHHLDHARNERCKSTRS